MAEVSAHATDAAARVTIEPTDATLGAVVRGVRLTGMADDEWNAIHAAFLDRGVLVFPGQFLTDAEQMDFGRRFGELMIESQPFSNERADGSLRGREDPVMQLFRGNESWHTDSSFQPVSAKASILSARKVPATGGETEWADMRAAYEALDDGTRERIASLCAHHSLYYSQQRIGAAGDVTAKGLAELHGTAGPASASGEDDGGASMPGYRQEQVVPLRPLVKVHPETGRPALYIGRHAHDIPGLSEEASRLLLEELVEFGCQPPRVYGHHWQVGRCGHLGQPPRTPPCPPLADERSEGHASHARCRGPGNGDGPERPLKRFQLPSGDPCGRPCSCDVRCRLIQHGRPQGSPLRGQRERPVKPT